MSPLKQQHGSTLIVALIMLVLLTLIAVSAINSTTTSIQVVGNEQFRQEASAAAQLGIEQIMSSNFTVAPAASAIPVTFGAASYTANVAQPVCTSQTALTNSSLNPFSAADNPCISSGQSVQSGIVGASGVTATSQSWCFRQTWDIKSSVTDSNTGANTTVHQGVYIRVPVGSTSC